MSWDETRDSVNRFKRAWNACDDDGKSMVVSWMIGIAFMVLAILIEFRWMGAMFVGGAAMWWASRVK